MKLSEYIKELQKIKKEHGDLEVTKTGFNGSVELVGCPKLAYAAKLEGRETKIRYAYKWEFKNSHDDDRDLGRGPIVRV